MTPKSTNGCPQRVPLPWPLVKSLLAALVSGLLLSPGMTADEVKTRAGDSMLGFSSENATSERALEKRFDAKLNPAELREWLQRMSSAPNHVGSPHDKANAEFMLERFRQWGWEARIETFDVLYPTPKKSSLELIAPTRFTARLHEPPVTGDRTS